ncbi:MAG: plasmid stabilization system protein ParE [Verrucomicrobiales bacterium]|jgi:plasmid stabilization system protein ParE
MEVILLLQAELDIQKIYNRLEDFQPELGDRFLTRLDRAYAQLQQFPESARIYRSRYRRKLVRGFNYGIFYVVESHRIVVGTVQNLQQDPKRIARELDDLGGK